MIPFGNTAKKKRQAATSRFLSTRAANRKNASQQSGGLFV